ncbi:hypothetical protein M407DRAFT_104390 [Tulasnella calospora MUT 4182]|uniref:Uncharacterized protein n=1 Tax=Tulasnella calospora MUT 4182 TaxID=1051891 RepID=A0A0C3QE36_9AGAM|nr:hypothetical protein M407DRAFT_116735 [Tulasnella calospora MUT 4182]KIO24046.1 hypothetical protein M407DRAFT_104390 [Tulasnella calospora MUT 4182]
MIPTLDALLSRCGRADLISLNQYILAANSQALIAIAITPPQLDSKRSQKLALASVVVTLVAIVTAMASPNAEVNAADNAANRRLDNNIKLSAVGMTLLALILFIIAIATIQAA